MHKFLIIPVFLLIIFSYKAYAQVDTLLTFSEIMFAPLSGQTEFVEVYNTSETDTIDLAGFKLKYLHTSNTDNIIAHNSGTKLNPKSFAIIFEDDYDFDSGIYNSLIAPEALVIKIDNNSFGPLTNSTDRTLLLINSFGDTVDTYTYSANNTNGISDEKIILNKDNSATNWSNSLTTNGTPGGKNSVSPKDYDLAINLINAPATVYEENEISISVEIENKGVIKSSEAVLELYDDYTNNNKADSYEKIYTENIDSLLHGEKVLVNTQIKNAALRQYKIIAVINLPADENKINDTLSVTVEVSPKPRKYNDIVINEIMFKPEDGEPEWIELYNRTGDEINLSGWRISDKSTTADIASVYMSPRSFLVLAKDNSIFEYYDNLENVIIVTSLPSLNNSGDDITLTDTEGRTIDNVNYISSWGGSSGGKSLERISAEQNSNDELNWGSSKSIYNATPGYINSITQKDFDLAISSLLIDPGIPFEEAWLEINLIIKNTGINTADSFFINIYSSSALENLLNSNSTIFSKEFTNLGSDDSIKINAVIDSLQLKQYYILAEIIYNKDNDTTNNKKTIEFFPKIKPADFNDIVINEIMYKPADDEPEWVELFNRSDKEINLINWKFSDRSTSILITSDSLKLKPGEFLVLSEDESIVDFYNVPSKIITLKLPSLNNSDENLYVTDQYGNIIDSVLYFSSWGGSSGSSLERISPEDSSNSPLNWGTAITKLKATPGKTNSVTPKEYDLLIQSFSADNEFIISPAYVKITAEIFNNGLTAVQAAAINFYNDTNKDSAATENELIHSTTLPQIKPGERSFYSFDYSDYKTGGNLLIAEIIFEHDEFTENNILFTGFTAVTINEVRNDIIINEFMPAPSAGRSEWIEIYNKSKKQIDFKNYKIADESDAATIINKSIIINPGEYFLIINDSSFFDQFHAGAKFIINNFPALNNTSDKIILLDSLNRVIDSLQYSSNWNGETGKSFERVDPFGKSGQVENWAVSKNISGGTPGEINSVTQKNYDAGISQIYFNPAKPFYGDEVLISAVIKNLGKENFIAKILLLEENNIMESINGINIFPSDSIVHEFNYKIEDIISQRDFSVKIEFDKDQDAANDTLSARIKPGYKHNSLIINEVMFTPLNGEPEWIEIYNKENYKINLSGWSISDILTNPVKTKITGSTYFIEPKSYLVIAKDSSIINFHDVIPSKILISSFANLNNSEDGVVIKDIYENLIDSVHYTSNWQTKTGCSIERISFHKIGGSENESSTDSSNWSSSIDIEQSTPGRLNSVSQKAYDLEIPGISFSPPRPKYGDDIIINVVVKNTGFLEANNFSIKFYEGINHTLFDEVTISSLAKNDSLKLTCAPVKLFYAQKYFVEINFPPDDNLTNNKNSITVIPSFNKNDILINEVMFNPGSGQPEWIEFINNTNHEINLFKWEVSDILPSPKIGLVTKNYFNIFPGQYFIITNDTVLFKSNYNVEIPVFQSSFGTLGNSEDGVVIYDYYKNVIDSLFYNSQFGNAKGSSIERLSLSDETNEINNWIVSINANGASPGYINSGAESKSYKFNQVVINEIMYEPGVGNTEFIEFYNTSDEIIELGGWVLENENGEFFRIVNSSHTLHPETFFVTSADSSIFDSYNFPGGGSFINILNKNDLALTNSEQLIILKDLKGNAIDSVRYNSKWHNPNVIDTKNKSLERLNPQINSHEASNWSTSANTNGATPGEQNSIFTDNKITSAGLTITPNPFSPDNDGFEDFCIINYSTGIPLSQIRIKIFDDKGRLVRMLANNQPSGSTGSIIFDGLNENNSPLKIGMYIVFFEATNAQTGQQEILKDVVVVARKL